MVLFQGNIGQIASRFTWELPQTLLGFGYAHTSNTVAGTVQDVDYFGGATVLKSSDLLFDNDEARGVTIGNYITGIGISSNPHERGPNGEITEGAELLRHEYGHYIQSQRNGWTYLPKYGIPSARGAKWTETDAGYRSDQYFGDKYFLNNGSYSSDYRPVNAKWWEHGLIFGAGYVPGSIIISILNIDKGR